MARTKDDDRGSRDDRSNRAPTRPARGESRRSRLPRATRLLTASTLILLLLPVATPAHAYLDPGTGSMILQVILGGVAGMVVAGKLYWKRVRESFGRRSIEAPGDADERGHDATSD